MAARYAVYVDDNGNYMDESERYKLGEFDDCESAIAACKRIVDEYLARVDPGKRFADKVGQALPPAKSRRILRRLV